MSQLTIQLPESWHGQIQELAAREGVSVEQFITSAAAEKLSAVLSDGFLRREAALGSRAEFDRVMAKLPPVPPEPGDELPADLQ
jgi:hypothetical protein